MIREEDLHEAIAECQGERNANAQTCIKLAAYYTILDHITGEQPDIITLPAVSRDEPPEQSIQLNSGSEFAEAVNGRAANEIMPMIDELVQTIAAIVPALYEAFIRKIKE